MRAHNISDMSHGMQCAMCSSSFIVVYLNQLVRNSSNKGLLTITILEPSGLIDVSCHDGYATCHSLCQYTALTLLSVKTKVVVCFVGPISIHHVYKMIKKLADFYRTVLHGNFNNAVI